MGQGYSLTTLSAASANIDVPELSDLRHDKTLASARFMKSVRATNERGFVFVKAIVKPYSSFEIQQYVNKIMSERAAVADVPNALGYQRIIETGTGGFLVRQYLHSSVYDRLSTRPFLEDIEKKWLSFQLLSAVRDCHAKNIFHGDIKTENLLVTSWNWLYLTDFSSSFKPTVLPEDNPADFSFYFDTAGRRSCYLAPERFTVNGVADTHSDLNWAEDIFSVGCSIAEIFLEGPIFSLSQIFKYRSGEYSPENTHLNKIEDPEVRAMVLNMIELDPEKRYNAEQHLSFYKSKIFPAYFYDFLHQYMLDLTEPSSGRRPIALDGGNSGDLDEKIERIHYDFDKISYFLGYPAAKSAGGRARRPTDVYQNHTEPFRHPDANSYDGTLLFLAVIVSSIRNTAKASAKLKALTLLVAFSARLPDEAKLDRVLPYVVGMLNDPSDIVRVATLKSMTSILSMVQVVSPINAYLYPEYIFPRLKQFILSPASQPSVIVRSTYASCLASLALSSNRILDMVQAIRADGRLPNISENEWAPEASYHGLYDIARAELVPHFEEATKALITDPETCVRRAFLGSVSDLCIFFGSAKANDVIVSHLNTYLNDKDWILKCSFYDALVGVAAYVGSASLERFILPIMVQSMSDSEPFVVEKVFRTLARMSHLGLLQKSTTWELVSIIARFLIHPSPWIRESAAQFVVSSSRYISPADKHCVILPLIQPFLRTATEELTEERILDSIKTPLSKVVFDVAVGWAERTSSSPFWQAARRDAVFMLSNPEEPGITSLTSRRLVAHIPRSQLGKEDQQPLARLREVGMARDDEIKLLALREYIYKVAHSETKGVQGERQNLLGDIVSLNHINVTPQNVFFDAQDPVKEIRSATAQAQQQSRVGEPSTITDALLDASTTIADRVSGLQSQATTPGQNTPKMVHNPSALPPALSIAVHEGEVEKNGPAEAAKGKGRSSLSDAVPPKDQPVSKVDTLSLKRSSSLSLRHRNSAMNLMNRRETAKADAAVSTSSETVFGRLDGPTQGRRPTEPSHIAKTPDAMAESHKMPSRGDSRDSVYTPNHSYSGTDPHVLRLLENHFMENYPIDHLDFGPTRRPVDIKDPIRRPNDVAAQTGGAVQAEQSKYHNEPWRPSGHLLTLYSEHTGTVNKVAVAPDHAFFVTASDDGTCKIWDTIRLEKNITPRSRHTHRHAQGAKVKSLSFVEDTHCFVSAADDGSIQVVKVDYRSIDGGESTRYGKPTVLRDYKLPPASNVRATEIPQEYAVWLHHYRTATSQSILVVATTHHRVLAIDLKSHSLDVIYMLSNPVHHGTPTTFCIDKKHHWLLLGTSHGILDLWDLRFRLRLRSFGIQRQERIDRVLVHPSKGLGKRVLISSGGEISVWDIEKVVCREVYRPSSWSQPDAAKAKPYEAWYPDDEPREKVVERFAKKLNSDETLMELNLRPDDSAPPTPTKSSNIAQHDIRTTPLTTPALHVVTDYVHNPANPASPDRYPMLLSGGADRTLRYWDLGRPELSRIISGPQLAVDDGNLDINGKMKIKARYVTDHPLSVSAGAQIAVVSEVLPSAPGQGGEGGEKGGSTSTQSTPSKRGAGRSGASTPGTDDRGKGTAGSSSANKPPRNTVISAAQQQLLRIHMDGITDVCLLRRPYGCVVSVDRAGCVFVFQ